MKISAVELKKLMDENKGNKLVESLFCYYFNGEIIPVIVTESKIVYYTPGSEQFYISEYSFGKNCLMVEGMKKLSFGKTDNNVEQKKETVFEGIFELDEGRETFKKSLKEIKKSINENQVILSEDVFIDRMKEMARGMVVNILQKNRTDYKVPENQDDDKAETNIDTCSKEVWKGIAKGTGPSLDSFYDAYDIKKVKFNWSDGKGLYKDIKIDFPKNKVWLAESKEEVEKLPEGKYTKDIEEYSSAVKDTEKFLKSKKYVEEEDQDPAFSERTSEFIGLFGKKEKAKNFWKWMPLKADLKEVYTNEMDVEDFVAKYDILHTFNHKELTTLMEKALVNSIEKANVLMEAPKIINVMEYVMDKTGTRDAYFTEILGTEVANSKQMVEEFNELSEEIKDYRSPDDDVMKFVERLIDTISDLMSKYKENNWSDNDQNAMAEILRRLNDIWARQRLTDSDKIFLDKIGEKIADIQDAEIKERDAQMKAQDERREGIAKIEKDILDKNEKGVGKNKTELGEKK